MHAATALPPDRAFVVQFTDDARLATDRVTGRVEHVVSGRSTHFASLEQLVTFLRQCLPDEGGPS